MTSQVERRLTRPNDSWRRRPGNHAENNGSIIGQFSRMVEGEGEHARALGRAFNRAEDRRLHTDYDEVLIPGTTDAFRKSAVEFAAYCRSPL